MRSIEYTHTISISPNKDFYTDRSVPNKLNLFFSLLAREFGILFFNEAGEIIKVFPTSSWDRIVFAKENSETINRTGNNPYLEFDVRLLESSSEVVKKIRNMFQLAGLLEFATISLLAKQRTLNITEGYALDPKYIRLDEK